MKKQNIAIIISSIFIILLLSILVPIFLDKYIWSNNTPSALNNSDWSSFLGSFLGGIIGSIGTLIAVCVTTLDTRYIQKDNNCQNIIKAATERLEVIVNSISSYWQKIKCIESYIDNLIINQNNLSVKTKDLDKIYEDLLKNNLTERIRNDLNLEYKKNLQQKVDLEHQITTLKEKTIKTFESLYYLKYHLQIFLQDFDFSTEFLNIINQIEEYTNEIIYQNNNYLVCDLKSKILLFDNYAKDFIKNYENSLIYQVKN